MVVPSGSLKSGRMDYDVFSNTQFKDISELENLVVAMSDAASGEKGGRRQRQIPVRVKDLGEVSDAHRQQSQIVRVDGDRAVYLKVYKQPGANTINTVEALRKRLSNLDNVPEGVELDVTFDQSTYIKNAITSLRHEAFLGTGLAMFVVLVFSGNRLGNPDRWAVPPAVCIGDVSCSVFHRRDPKCLYVGRTRAVGWPLGRQCHYCCREHSPSPARRKSPLRAALDGTREVAAPVFAATLTTVIVFAPVWFLSGISRYLFSPMGLTIGVSMFASYAISLTVIPVLARRFAPKSDHGDHAQNANFKPPSWSGRMAARIESTLLATESRYTDSLKRVFGAKAKLFVGVAVAFLGSQYLATQLGADFFPPIDEGEFTMAFRAPIGTRVEESEKIAAQLETVVRDVVPPEALKTVLASVGAPKRGLRAMLASNSGSHAGKVRVELAPPQERQHGVEHYIALARKAAKKELPGVALMFSPRGSVREIINFGYRAPIVVEARGYDAEKGAALARDIEAALGTVPGLADVKSIRQDDHPNIQVIVDRQRASRFGITQHDIARVLLGSVFGNTSRPPFITDPKTGVNYEIITRLAPRYRDDIRSLGKSRFNTTVNPSCCVPWRTSDARLAPWKCSVGIKSVSPKLPRTFFLAPTLAVFPQPFARSWRSFRCRRASQYP